MILLIHVQNVTTIDLIVSEIIFLIKINTEGEQTDKQTERPKRETYSFLLGVMGRRENMKVLSPYFYARKVKSYCH